MSVRGDPGEVAEERPVNTKSAGLCGTGNVPPYKIIPQVPKALWPFKIGDCEEN